MRSTFDQRLPSAERVPSDTVPDTKAVPLGYVILVMRSFIVPSTLESVIIPKYVSSERLGEALLDGLVLELGETDKELEGLTLEDGLKLADGD